MWSFLRAAVLVLGLMVAQEASAAIALVNGHNAFSQNASTGQSVTATINSTTAGNFIVVGIFWCASASCDTVSGSVSTVTSSAGETCSLAAGANNASPTQPYMTSIYFCQNIVGGNDTITVTMSGGFTANYLGALISEWSGVKTSTADDNVGNVGNGTSLTSLTLSTNGSTSVSGDLIYAIGAATNTISVGQTGINTGNATLKDEYQIAGAAGSYSNTWSQSPASGLSGSVAAFKPATGGATAVPLPMRQPFGIGR